MNTNNCNSSNSMMMATPGFALAAQNKRKEKARIAARARRSQEASIIMDMANELHITQERIRRLDKATIVKLAIDYIKAFEILCRFRTICVPLSLSSSLSSSPSSNTLIPLIQQNDSSSSSFLLMTNNTIDDDDNSSDQQQQQVTNNQNLNNQNQKHAIINITGNIKIETNTNDHDNNQSNSFNKQQQQQLQQQLQLQISEYEPLVGTVRDEEIIAQTVAPITSVEATTTINDHQNNNHHQHNHNQCRPLPLPPPQQLQPQPQSQPTPKFNTGSIFAHRTDEVDSHFLVIKELQNGRAAFVLKPDTEIMDEDDLTHLAPQAGDSVLLEVEPLDEIVINSSLFKI